MSIEKTLENHDFEVRSLLRRYHILGAPNMDTIKVAHDQHGENFMMKLLEVLVPDTDSFTELITPITPFVTTSKELDTKTLATAIEPTTVEEKGKVWSFWENLLNGISQTGATLGQFKESLNASPKTPVYTEQEAAAASTRSKTIYIVAGSLVAFIILILILRK